MIDVLVAVAFGARDVPNGSAPPTTIEVLGGAEGLPIEAYVPILLQKARWTAPIAPVSPTEDAFGSYAVVACGVRAMYGLSGEPEEIAWYNAGPLCTEPFRESLERAFLASRVRPRRRPVRVGVAMELDFPVPSAVRPR